MTVFNMSSGLLLTLDARAADGEEQSRLTTQHSGAVCDRYQSVILYYCAFNAPTSFHWAAAASG